MRRTRLWHIWTICIALAAGVAAAGTVEDKAAAILQASGVKGGLVVHIGCGDGRLTAALHANDRYLVEGLDADAAKVRQARERFLAAKLAGKVSARTFDGRHLPYVENLVNLVVCEGPTNVGKDEILRVLAPLGVAMMDGRKIVKPWPKDIDEWTHFLHGPDNNAVAEDLRAAEPRSFQWVATPRWCRSHEQLASMSAAVTAAGRIFYIVDEAPLATIRFLGDWKLVARDAFNGTLLWEKPIGPWIDHLRHFRSGPVHLPRRLVAVGQTVYVTPGITKGVVALDAATGRLLRRYEGTDRAEEIIVDGGVLYVVVGTSEVVRRGGGLFDRGEPKPTSYRFIAAIRADTGRTLWKKDFSKNKQEYLLPLSLTVRGPHVYYESTKYVACLDAATGKVLWQTPHQTPRRRMSFSGPTVVATDKVLLCADRNVGRTEKDAPAAGVVEWGVHGWNEPGFQRKTPCTLRAYSTADGRELWSVPCQEGYNSPVDVFVVGRTVWVGLKRKGYDLLTGAAKGQINLSAPRVGMPHHRCYRDKATTRFIFGGHSGIEVYSLAKLRWLSNNSWIRGTCQYGIMPANGLLYAPPDACACFLTVKVPGFFVAAPQRDPSGHMPFPAEPVLVKGPAFG
ncbi:MAG: PQQ-binding-like beta-propeller repeat protein, partial [Planctomycetes bacterium]|nr:PQQ-binding-like beta-propeller repeat protein [Planctomycetota bacterium]